MIAPMRSPAENPLQTAFIYMILIGMATCGSACSRESSILNATHQDWSFIQKLGGMEIGELKALPNGEYFLPVKVDISGATTVTRKPETSDGISIGKIKQGIYKVKYLNNDGSTEDIRIVKAE